MGKTLYEKLRTYGNLDKAWRAIRANGINSTSRVTKEDIEDFGRDIYRHTRRIQKQLTERRYAFAPAIGVPVARKGKPPRPLVLARIQDRIVQRAILQILGSHEPLRAILDVETSFGTSRTQSIARAMAVLQDHLRSDTKYVIRSDIRDFFTRVPRTTVLHALEPLIEDADLAQLLDQATHVELANLAALGANTDYFPDDTTGVAQGSSLSPLIGNVFLCEFDSVTNAHGVTCLRYVDDFLLLGPDERTTRNAFRVALRWLSSRGLEAHQFDSKKCHAGPADKPFEFLGCLVQPGLVTPSSESRKRLHDTVARRLEESLATSCAGTRACPPSLSVARTLYRVGSTVGAWASAYRFCTDGNAIAHLEAKIDQLVLEYVNGVNKNLLQQPLRRQCEVLGIPSMTAIVPKSDAGAT